MSINGDTAAQVIKLSVRGAEVAARITGRAAKDIARLLVMMMRQEGRTSGKARLSSLMRSGRELRVFSVEERDLPLFAKHAKEYGVLYCVLKDRDAKGCGTVDIIAKAEDGAKISRIFERFGITPDYDRASFLPEVSREEETTPRMTKGEQIAKIAVLSAEEKAQNPPAALAEKSLSEQDSGGSRESLKDDLPSMYGKRPSIRLKLERLIEQSRLNDPEARAREIAEKMIDTQRSK